MLQIKATVEMIVRRNMWSDTLKANSKVFEFGNKNVEGNSHVLFFEQQQQKYWF